uniref:Uncharacterized protein n=1 Tax=Setaria italica TaxID=4555 RepID=K3Z1W1_SETIT
MHVEWRKKQRHNWCRLEPTVPFLLYEDGSCYCFLAYNNWSCYILFF